MTMNNTKYARKTLVLFDASLKADCTSHHIFPAALKSPTIVASIHVILLDILTVIHYESKLNSNIGLLFV